MTGGAANDEKMQYNPVGIPLYIFQYIQGKKPVELRTGARVGLCPEPQQESNTGAEHQR